MVLLRATSVFTCQHSKLPRDIVAKVLRYSNNSIYNLIGITKSWKDEQKALSNLHHVSILPARKDLLYVSSEKYCVSKSV